MSERVRPTPGALYSLQNQICRSKSAQKYGVIEQTGKLGNRWKDMNSQIVKSQILEMEALENGKQDKVF